MQRIKRFVTGMVALLAITIPTIGLAAPVAVNAAPNVDNICKGILYTEADGGDCGAGGDAEDYYRHLLDRSWCGFGHHDHHRWLALYHLCR